MKRIMLTVAYEGTEYHGWQKEPGVRTIEGELNEALGRLTHESLEVSGASRTDAGVHALGNLCVFDTASPIPADRIAPALNAFLPPDIVVMRSCEVDPCFHPRLCDSIKTYTYRLHLEAFPNPLLRRTSLHFYRPLQAERMRRAGALLVGEHDFKSFCAAGAQVRSTVRRILSLEIREMDAMMEIQVRGTGFLYNMVRIIVGTLLKVGMGQWEPERITDILQARDRAKAGPTAPPEGLCLQKIVLYPEGFPRGLWEGRQDAE